MLNVRPLLFVGRTRPEYLEYLRNNSDSQLFNDVGFTLGCVTAIVAIRLLFNYLFKARAIALVEAATHEHHRDGRKLLEECWVMVGNAVMLAWSTYIMMAQNGGCWFGNTNTCLAGWPLHPTPPAVRLYYNAELAWYLHLLLKPVLRYGMSDGRDMVVHHLCTLALVVGSYGLGLTRSGVLVLCTFNLSNPFLHAAKICNQLGLRIRMPAFGLFALVFAITRVVLVPHVLLRLTLLQSRQQVPMVIEDFWMLYVTLNVLLGVLYGLQLMWMWSIARVLRQAVVAGGDAASHLSTQVDPSKRYRMAQGNGAAVVEGNGAVAANGYVAVKKEA